MTRNSYELQVRKKIHEVYSLLTVCAQSQGETTTCLILQKFLIDQIRSPDSSHSYYQADNARKKTPLNL